VDAIGQLLVANSKHNCIRVYSPEGRLITSLDSIGIESSPLDLPVDVAMLNDGLFAVLDKNGRISIV
jgi:hypothetical protein